MSQESEIVRFHCAPTSLPEVCGGRPIGFFYSYSFDTGRPNLVTVAYYGDVQGQYRRAQLAMNDLLAGRPFSWESPLGLTAVDIAVLLMAHRLKATQPLMSEEERRMRLARVRESFQPAKATDEQTRILEIP